jgi:hypothetical protein
MFEETHYDRRRFLGTTAIHHCRSSTRHVGLANAQPRQTKPSYAHRIIQGGVGHNLSQEAPRAFTEAVLDVDGD